MNRRHFLLALPVAAVAAKVATPAPVPAAWPIANVPEMAMFDYIDTLIGAASGGRPGFTRQQRRNAQARRRYAARRSA